MTILTHTPDVTDARVGRVVLVGAGPGDPDLLTLKALKALARADVVLHDRLVAPEILALINPQAVVIDAGKTGFGPSTPQARIHDLMIHHARAGACVVRLKAGDPAVFARLDEELCALDAAAVPYAIVPGITAASAASAQIAQPLTARGRNADLRLLTGHDMAGFADQDWYALARPGAVAAIYMGKRSARFTQGRLLMHGADPATPVTLVENASRAGSRVVLSSLAALAQDVAALTGPAVILFGLAPRESAAIIQAMEVAQ